MKQGREHWGSQGKGQVAEAGQSRMPAPLCTRKGPALLPLRSIEQDESLGRMEEEARTGHGAHPLHPGSLSCRQESQCRAGPPTAWDGAGGCRSQLQVAGSSGED